MKFRTEIQPLKKCPTIDYRSCILMVGSCFTDEIGGRLRQDMFDVSVNPFGTLFNPESIATSIEDALNNRQFSSDELFQYEGRWRTFDRHSSLALADRDATVELLNRVNAEVGQTLRRCDWLIVTFGSAIAFNLNADYHIVANCHKQPQQLFSRVELSIDYITYRWHDLLLRLRAINPALKVVFTVSPVRHIGYGAVADRRSKSRLILACEALCNGPGTIYFPSYEIMVDDLRDYRFYADDMVHPSTTAVDYIYDIFAQSLTTEATRAEAKLWHRLSLRASHRFDTPNGAFADATNALAVSLASQSDADTDEMLKRFHNYSDYLKNKS